MISKDAALLLIRQHGQSEGIIKHLLTVGAAMRSLATHFGASEDEWELAGLVHDADYNLVPLERHTLGTMEWFAGQLTPDIEQAVTRHNFKNNGHQPVTKMDWALYSVDNLAGLIVASTLVRPDKKLSGLTVQSVLKRYRETSFAKGADREEIASCSELGLTLEEFVGIVLPGIQAIADEVGL